LTARRTELDSGATVVSETMGGVQSVALGIYFPTGSRHETPETNGISHFIEHLVFKGTQKRTADQINREIDLLGGASNAYTSKEVICLHGRVLDEHLERLIEFFGDLAVHALPSGVDPEVERERDVILSEISAVEDAPEDLVGDLADQAFFGDHPLGLPVVGSARAVERLSLDKIRRHYRGHLVAKNMVVAAAGSLEHAELVRAVERHLDGLSRGEPAGSVGAPVLQRATRVLIRDHEQVHLCLSAPGISRGDPRFAVQEVLSAIVGEGFSSRLFREVRDRRGLAYSVYSSTASYMDTGSFNVALSVAPERLAEALDVVGRVLGEIHRGELDAEELGAARSHVRGSFVLSHESPGARESFLAEQAMLGSPHLDLSVELRAIAEVELASLRELAAELFAGPWSLAAVGPVPPGILPADGWTPEI